MLDLNSPNQAKHTLFKYKRNRHSSDDFMVKSIALKQNKETKLIEAITESQIDGD